MISDISKIAAYIESFRLGCPPHAGELTFIVTVNNYILKMLSFKLQTDTSILFILLLNMTSF